MVQKEAKNGAAMDSMCAAVKSVAALLLCTYFLNDQPAHMLNKHKVFSSYIWRPVQRPTPFVVRQVWYLGGKIFITFIKLKEVVPWEELSLLLETTEHNRARQKGLAGLKMSDEKLLLVFSFFLGHIWCILFKFEEETKPQMNVLSK